MTVIKNSKIDGTGMDALGDVKDLNELFDRCNDLNFSVDVNPPDDIKQEDCKLEVTEKHSVLASISEVDAKDINLENKEITNDGTQEVIDHGDAKPINENGTIEATEGDNNSSNDFEVAPK
jgi:hypothetical protein